MGYLEQFEAELAVLLKSGQDVDTIVKWVRQRVVVSYKNGIAEGKKGGAVPPAQPSQA